MELRPNANHPKSDPRYNTANVLAALDDLIRHLRAYARIRRAQGAGAVRNQRRSAGGLRTAFQHYESGAEAAMREPRGH
jgi:hypothetical protein